MQTGGFKLLARRNLSDYRGVGRLSRFWIRLPNPDLGYDQLSEAAIQLLFLEQSEDDLPNERLVNTARGMAQLFIERQIRKSKIENVPAWWVRAQTDYLSANFLSESF